jgi:hypothetical protein
MERARYLFAVVQILIKDKPGIFWGLSTTVSGHKALESGGDAGATFII